MINVKQPCIFLNSKGCCKPIFAAYQLLCLVLHKKAGQDKVKSMKYDFTTKLNRAGSGSLKWDAMYQINPQVMPDVVPLSVADMEFKMPPELTEGLKQHLDTAVLGYTGPTPAFTDAVQHWMLKRHNWHIKPEWVIPIAGVVPAIFHAVRAFTEPGDGVIVLTPVYYPFFRAVQLQGRNAARCPLHEDNGQYTIDFDTLARLAADPHNKALLFCSPHNPVGRVWKKEELQKIQEIVLEHNLYLFSDEIHFDIIMPGAEHTVFQSLSDELAERTITFTAPTKTFNIAGLGISNIIIKNEKMRTRFVEEQDKGSGTLFTALSYKACEICYTQCSAWLDEFLSVIDSNQRLVQHFFQTRHPEIKAPLIEGTYLQWLDFRALGMEYKALEQFMTHTAQVFLDEGYIFGEEGRGFERINLAAPASVLTETLERLSSALAKLKH